MSSDLGRRGRKKERPYPGSPEENCELTVGMPKFEMLGTVYEVSQGDLDKAPDFVLAEAWSVATSDVTVRLDSWPAPSSVIFKVRRAGYEIHVDLCVSYTADHTAVGPWCLQEVLRYLSSNDEDVPDVVDASFILDALQYFGIPIKLWPFGLQVKHDVLREAEQQLQSHFPTAKALLDQMCTSIAGMVTAELATRALQSCKLSSATSCEDVLKGADFGVVFEVGRQYPYVGAESFLVTEPIHALAYTSSRMGTATTIPPELCVALRILAHRRRMHVNVQGEAPSSYIHSRSVIEINFG